MILLALAVLVWRGWHTPAVAELPGADAAASPELIAHGAYLARAGNCLGCHSAPGGKPFECRMCAFFLFEGDRITNERVYYDRKTIFDQIS